MAIDFARLMPIKLTSQSGAVRPLAYTARTKLHDPYLELEFDYSDIADDYVCGDIIVPEGHPSTFKTLSVYAASLDAAEWAKVRTSLEQRERPPQVGLTLVVALPPNDELWISEAAELMKRIVTAPPRSNEVAIHWAIHEARINRHGHAFYALRTFDAEGNASPKLRDFMVHHRSTALGADIVEGVNWPQLSWEVQQTFFEELGLDLVVDPIAPVPGKHYSPVVYANGMNHDEQRRDRVVRSRERAYAANVEAIRNNPEELVETLLRGRSTIRTLELERLCTKFFDHPADRDANVERIMVDDDVMTLADKGAEKSSYLTTRRVYDLMKQAADIIDTSRADISTITGADRVSLARRIVTHFDGCDDPGPPLILGHALSDCRDVAVALEDKAPVMGTIDMAVIGPEDLLAIGRERDLVLRPGRLVIVPRVDRIDDQCLARLLLEADRCKVRLILGHNQSNAHGVVHRNLAAYVADQPDVVSERYGRNDIERLLRAGQVRRAIEAVAASDLVSFGELSDHGADDPRLFVVCRERSRLKELADTFREQRIRARTFEHSEELTTLRGTISLSVGEWIVTTQACEHPRIQTGEFAEIVTIDPSNSTIEIKHENEIKRLDLEMFAAIRSATTITIREARRLPTDLALVVELTDRRRIWAALLLVARRHGDARLYVDPVLARSVEELTDIARRSLPGALPHHREIKADPSVEISRNSPLIEGEELFEPVAFPESVVATPPSPQPVHLNGAVRDTVAEISNNLPPIEAEDPLEPVAFPEPVAATPPPPPPIHLEERIRRTIATNVHACEGYRELYRHVGPHNRDRHLNAARIQGLCTSDLTVALVRFLAELEPQHYRGEFDDYDMPPELTEHDPTRWTLIEIQNAKYDLQTMALPGANWGFRPPIGLRVRGNFSRLFENNETSRDKI
jgi:hypothetical protein